MGEQRGAIACPECEEPMGSAEDWCWNCSEPVENPVVLPWPENRECAACGHIRDVHGAYVMLNGGYRCNRRGGCDCPGFTPHRASTSEGDDRG